MLLLLRLSALVLLLLLLNMGWLLVSLLGSLMVGGSWVLPPCTVGRHLGTEEGGGGRHAGGRQGGRGEGGENNRLSSWYLRCSLMLMLLFLLVLLLLPRAGVHLGEAEGQLEVRHLRLQLLDPLLQGEDLASCLVPLHPEVPIGSLQQRVLAHLLF